MKQPSSKAIRILAALLLVAGMITLQYIRIEPLSYWIFLKNMRKKCWGHSNSQATHQFFEQTGAHKRLITHHDPSHSDANLKRLEKLCSIEHIRDGQLIQLS